jgi:hypothetical protein
MNNILKVSFILALSLSTSCWAQYRSNEEDIAAAIMAEIASKRARTVASESEIAQDSEGQPPRSDSMGAMEAEAAEGVLAYPDFDENEVPNNNAEWNPQARQLSFGAWHNRPGSTDDDLSRRVRQRPLNVPEIPEFVAPAVALPNNDPVPEEFRHYPMPEDTFRFGGGKEFGSFFGGSPQF